MWFCGHCATYNEDSKEHCRACHTHKDDKARYEIPKLHASLPTEPTQAESIFARLHKRSSQ